MGFQCIDLDENGLTLKKYRVEISPFLQSKTGFDAIIFTNDINGLIQSLKTSYGENIQHEVSYNLLSLDERGQERFDKIKSMFLEEKDIINNIEDYSFFIYYGYILSKTKASGLKIIKPQYEDRSLTYLTDYLKSKVKVIRKDVLNTVINFKGNPFKFDQKSISNLSMLSASLSLIEGEQVIEYRLENGEFIELNEKELKEVLTYGLNFLLKVMKVEKEIVKKYSSLPIEELEEILLADRQEEIKINFDKKLKEAL